MKNQIKFIVLTLLICIIFAPSVLAEENENVFRDLSWRDEPEVLEEHRRVQDEETNNLDDKNYGLNIYVKRNEELTLGSVELFDIHYYFFEDKLAKIRLDFSYNDHSNAKRMLESRYGDPTFNLTPTNSMRRTWKNEKTKIILDDGGVFNDSYIIFSNIDLIKELEEWQEEQKQKKAEEDSQEW